jgi:hypothetical protein
MKHGLGRDEMSKEFTRRLAPVEKLGFLSGVQIAL